jgi:hypothetical protein
VATTTRDNAERLVRLVRAWHEAAEGMRRLCGGAHTHGDHTASSSFASTIVCVVYDGDIVHVKDNKADGLAAMGYVWSENDAPAPRRSDAPLTGPFRATPPHVLRGVVSLAEARRSPGRIRRPR